MRKISQTVRMDMGIWEGGQEVVSQQENTAEEIEEEGQEQEGQNLLL